MSDNKLSPVEINLLKRTYLPLILGIDSQGGMFTVEQRIRNYFLDLFFTRFKNRFKVTNLAMGIKAFQNQQVKLITAFIATISDIASNYHDLTKATATIKNVEATDDATRMTLMYEHEVHIDALCKRFNINTSLEVEEIWAAISEKIISLMGEIQINEKLSDKEVIAIFERSTIALAQILDFIKTYLGSAEFAKAVEEQSKIPKGLHKTPGNGSAASREEAKQLVGSEN